MEEIEPFEDTSIVIYNGRDSYRIHSSQPRAQANLCEGEGFGLRSLRNRQMSSAYFIVQLFCADNSPSGISRGLHSPELVFLVGWVLRDARN